MPCKRSMSRCLSNSEWNDSWWLGSVGDDGRVVGRACWSCGRGWVFQYSSTWCCAAFQCRTQIEYVNVNSQHSQWHLTLPHASSWHFGFCLHDPRPVPSAKCKLVLGYLISLNGCLITIKSTKIVKASVLPWFCLGDLRSMGNDNMAFHKIRPTSWAELAIPQTNPFREI